MNTITRRLTMRRKLGPHNATSLSLRGHRSSATRCNNLTLLISVIVSIDSYWLVMAWSVFNSIKHKQGMLSLDGRHSARINKQVPHDANELIRIQQLDLYKSVCTFRNRVNLRHSDFRTLEHDVQFVSTSAVYNLKPRLQSTFE